MHSSNLKALKMFDAASRHLNFRLAAEELNLTQGAVAQQVRNLESNLKVALFHRRARGLELTDNGKDYQRQIHRALTIIDSATAKLIKKNNQITLSVTPSFASKWLVPRLAKFTSDHPDIDLRIVASGNLSNFKTDGIDIAVRITKKPFSLEHDVIELAPITLCAVCSMEFSSKLTTPTWPFDFHKYQLIQDGHFYWEYLLESIKNTNSSKILQFNQTSLAIDAAANGQGITLSPLILVSEEIASGKLVDLWRTKDNGSENAYYLLSLKSAPENSSRDQVIHWLLNAARESIAM
ncbi:LysR substrate-binding domain-containing protein [Marinomonas sp. 2405UD68-3]|uniref:LysR substrate-binding domain-containing protein n=1 Tax=Marinomonas sp. 2405UD68-3 TaxID=3391835 RepID=UPI0039C8FB43